MNRVILCGLRLCGYFCAAFICQLMSHPAAAGTLTLVTSSSVAGSPLAQTAATRTQSFKITDTVSYSYKPTQGFSAAVVVLDGEVVANSGEIAMNADHYLFAYGNPEAGTAFDNMVTVPADLTQITYPQFFSGRSGSTIKVNNPYCALTAETVSFPASYLGSFPMPDVKGAPLAANIKRGAALKDYWNYGINNASTNSNCTGDLHTAFIASLVRLKNLGVDHINIYRDSQLEDVDAAEFKILPTASWSISAEEYKWINDQARAIGLKVHEYRQLVDGDLKNKPLSTSPTVAWATKFLDGYTKFIVDRAKEAESNGVEAFLLDWGVYWWSNTKDPEIKALLAQKMATAAHKVREVYSGKIMYGLLTNGYNTDDATLLEAIDLLIINSWMINISEEDEKNISVALLKQKYLELYQGLANAYGPKRKPAIFQVYAQSQRNWFKGGWVEDGFCTNNCEQYKVTVDFSIQAIAYEAMLEAINEQTSFETASVDATAYWYTDAIMPNGTTKSAFPNLSQSWRNKPAEAILRKWFAGSTSAPQAVVKEGAVFSSKQAAAGSFLRIDNTSATDAGVTVTLRNGTTGLPFSQWTSPIVPAGGSKQFAVSDIEAPAGSIRRPDYFTMSVQSPVAGSLQHVLYRPADGTLTNLSTCETGVTANPLALTYVHSSLLGPLGFPGMIVVTSTGNTAQSVTLGIYNADTGKKLGAYRTGAIAAGAQLRLSMNTIENGGGVNPGTTIYHLNIKAESAFTGFLQQLVSNQVAGVVTDMTTVCAFASSASAATVSTDPVYVAINSTTQTEGQSLLRLYNSASTAQTADVTLTDDSGVVRGTWKTPSIAAGAMRQFDVAGIETAAGLGSTTRPANFRLTVQPAWRGAIQHVLYRPSDGTLSNLSTCDRGVTADATALFYAHSSLLDWGFPSEVIVINTGTVAMNMQMGIYNADTGVRLGTYSTGQIPAGGQAMLRMSTIEKAAGIIPGEDVYHYNIKAENTFTGFLQHLVTNIKAGVSTDMTTVCALQHS